MDSYQFDKDISLQYASPEVIGVDEAGRGPLAGPVVAAAVILPEEPEIVGLRDSKIIPQEQREALYFSIYEDALSVSVAVVEAKEIDELNILRATLQAMRHAVQGLNRTTTLALVDGNQKPQSGCREISVVKGDSKSAAIMAASIIAKVTRDQIMVSYHEQYPQYGFNEHKGYGAAKHLEALKKHGPCPIHRRSFEPVKSLIQKGPLQKLDQEDLWSGVLQT